MTCRPSHGGYSSVLGLRGPDGRVTGVLTASYSLAALLPRITQARRMPSA